MSKPFVNGPNLAAVYFLKPKGMDGPIKIGATTHMDERFAHFAAWSPFPLEVMAVVWDGSFSMERRLHACFHDCHSHGEWFHPAPRLVEAVRQIANGVPVDEAVDLNDIRGKHPFAGAAPRKGGTA